MMSTRMFRRPFGFLIAPILGVLLVATGASTADALTGPATTLYASPAGSGTSCTSMRPCSLTTSQVLARTAAHGGMDVTVLLAGGTYQLAAPLMLTSADSGLTGRRVAYQAMSGQNPIFSGGRVVTRWRQYSTSMNIWVASVAGLRATRQLYVNGQRASLASAPATSVFGTLTPTSFGYQTSQTPALNSWTNAADQPDLIYTGVPFSWATSLCGITAVSGTSLTMASPCFQNLQTPLPWYTTSPSALSGAAYVENNLALLTQPGQFYVSTASGQVFYIPRPGETMSTANVVAPQLSSLVTATNVANLTISGVTFSYATWLPSATQGMVDIQSNVYATSSSQNWAVMPSAVSSVGGINLVFAQNTMIHLGGGGVSFDGGGTGNSVIGNVITDVSGTGVNISSPLAAPESNDQVTNNYIHHVSVEYEGGVGIFAGEVAHTTIAHNEIWALPGNGISLGWGWGPTASMTDNHVDYNRIHDINQSAMYDGGAIYLNGGENGAPQNSSVSGNYISGDPQPYGVIFLEAGASNYAVSSNIVLHTSTNWVYLQSQQFGNPAIDNVISGNYTDATQSSLCLAISTVCSAAATIDTSNVLSNNTIITSLTDAVASLITGAGIQAPYASITGGTVDSNLSYATSDTASSTDPASQPPSAANDGNSGTTWTSAVGDTGAIWQTDLGSARTLSEVQGLPNEGSDLTASRANLKVVVSNSPITATNPGATACAIASPGVAWRGIIDCAAPSGTWRYVGFVATNGQQLSLAEVRVFGH